MGPTQSFPAGTTKRLPNKIYMLILQDLDPDDTAIHSLSLLPQFNRLANTFLYKSIKIDLSNMKGDILAHKLAFTLAEKPKLARIIKHLALCRGKDNMLYWHMLSTSPTKPLKTVLFGYTSLQLQYFEHLRQTTPYTMEAKFLPLILNSAKHLIQFELEYHTDHTAKAHGENVKQKGSVELELIAYSLGNLRGFPHLQAVPDILAPTLTMFSMVFISGVFDLPGFEKLDLS
ncbi:hypothetical protein FA15DRAFT_702468 [Coprinopsis marcescibilis]|uniref:F-box domain-containing protein n=1 Tax=Coprinopsis marcescibilis TaxID=230819 RepID=A0A5C3L2G0_COPMA|nr:hypothetical protein FA15DRAFT_702468 [Coprinopsis marcescibilis]